MIDDRPNIRHFAALAATAKFGSVNRAARAVNLSQPALTQAILGLERSLGADLFERSARGMTPTEPGLMMAARAEAAIELVGSPRVTGTQMRAFLAIAQHGSYAAAAAELNLSAASLHRAVADLSVALGQRLCDRQGRSLFLTSAGQKRARNFGLAMAELRAGISEVSSWLGRQAGRIVIGAMPLSRARWLPETLTQYSTTAPGIEIVIREGSHAELVGPLRNGEVDILLGALREDGLFEDLVQEDVFDDQLAIIMRAGHEFANSKNSRALAEFPWIMPAMTTPLRRYWESMIARTADISPPIWIECGSVMLARNLLQTSDALTLLSPDQVNLELQCGLLVSRPTPVPLVRSIGIIARHSWRPTSDQTRFIDTLRRIGASFNK